MEELRSTEALDREILEDARKKADRLLRSAESTKSALDETWQKKTKDDISVLEHKHERRSAAQRKETLARLPLDKRRARAERADRLLQEAMHGYLFSLPRKDLLTVMGRELKQRAKLLPPTNVRVRASGLSKTELEALFNSCLDKVSWTLEDLQADGELPELSAESGPVRVRIGIEEVAQELLAEHRSELAVSLLGEETAND